MSTTTEVHPVDQMLPTPRLLALGLQHVLVMYAGAVAVPLIIGRALKLPPEDMTRRIDQEGHLFGERMRSKEAISAFQKFFDRKKG